MYFKGVGVVCMHWLACVHEVTQWQTHNCHRQLAYTVVIITNCGIISDSDALSCSC